MKIVLWSLLALFLIGDALFVLPWHLSADSLTTSVSVNYKRDSLLLKNVFPDSGIQLVLNMPPLYANIYKGSAAFKNKATVNNQLIVNVSVLHNLDFSALCFPFYKVTTFNSIIPFYSIIRASNAPDLDSTALVGNIIINGKLTVAGISSPLYARTLVEKELEAILQKELEKVETDINRQPVKDTTINMVVPEPAVQKRPVKNKK